MKILLISLYHFENMGVRLLQPILKEKGHKCDILFFKGTGSKVVKKSLLNNRETRDVLMPPNDNDFNKLKEFIDKTKPEVVGLSVMSSYFNVAVKLTSFIKENSDAVVVWGGAHPTIAPEDCVQYADYLCIGEGVESFPELIENLNNDKKVRNISGIAYNDKGKLKLNQSSKPYEKLDTLPFVDFSNEDKYYLEKGNIFKNGADWGLTGCVDTPNKSYHTIMTSWGCPFKCTYCINALFTAKVRRRSVDNVIKELKQVKENNPHLKMIFFYDDVFTINKKWCEEFAEKYKKEIDLPFWCYAHPKTTKYDILKILREAGMIMVIMGIQSGDSETRKLMGRFESDEEIIKAAENLNKMKDIPYNDFGDYFICFYDLIKDNPLENKEELDNTLDLLCKLPKDFVLQQFSLTHFKHYPLTDLLIERKLVDKSEIEGAEKQEDNIKDYFASFNADEKDERKKLQNFYYLLFAMTQYKRFSNKKIKKIAKSKFWYNHQGLLFKRIRAGRTLSFLAKTGFFLKSSKLVAWKLKKQLKKLLNIKKEIPIN